MLPIKDINPRRTFPIVNLSIIILNCIVFYYEIILGPKLEQFFYIYGLVPLNVTTSLARGTFILHDIIPFFTSMFLHGGWMHIIGNMLYLWIFGDNVEDKLGHFVYLIFYLLCGIGAAIFHILVDPFSELPTIGASGAIAGVLGAYMLIFPRARVLTLIPIFIFIQIAEVPAFFLLFMWFILQFFNGVLSLGFNTSGFGGVAWWAHIGGFIVGMLLAMFLKLRGKTKYYSHYW
ncbi:MAG: rhomboid family intramembrane serine protease [Bacteroidetes bacterium]|nr:rhomboid family intramembrane serine protease [Bacteroidota bacterium]